ncbi:helix-turn-helix domain-containing protein [Pyxidicoccus fallax]|nr:helix-turn-helix domain-containing protein [Pyxidicoccus fallax]
MSLIRCRPGWVRKLPPLRDRPRELPLLATRFLKEACERAGQPAPRLSAATMGVLSAHSWPGNVRELKNAMEYAAATSNGPILEPSSLPESLREARNSGEQADTEPAPRPFRPISEELRELERQRMLEALETTGGVQTRAAQLIGMPLRTFVFKARQYQLSQRSRAPRS